MLWRLDFKWHLPFTCLSTHSLSFTFTQRRKRKAPSDLQTVIWFSSPSFIQILSPFSAWPSDLGAPRQTWQAPGETWLPLGEHLQAVAAHLQWGFRSPSPSDAGSVRPRDVSQRAGRAVPRPAKFISSKTRAQTNRKQPATVERRALWLHLLPTGHLLSSLCKKSVGLGNV